MDLSFRFRHDKLADMIRMLRSRTRRLGAVMAFFAMLFAFAPVVEASACAAQGCGVICAEEGSGADTQNNGGCDEQNCICAASHCSHSAVSPLEPATVAMAAARPTVVAVWVERVVSTIFATPERPPRA